MNFDTVKEKYLFQIDQKIEAYLHSFGKENLNAKMSAYHLQTGGKRLRALIPLLMFECLGKNPEDAIPFGCAVEIVHNATLVHDDLQDGDEYRRSLPTIWKKYGVAQAINCGDAFFQYAFDFLVQFKIPSENILKLISRMTRSTLNVIEGQAQEFLMKEESYPTLARYIEVVTGKTSGLFSLPVVGSLEALGIDSKTCAEVEDVTGKLGVLFQIQDDVLDIYGSKGREEQATDIAEGKISALVTHVYEVGSEEDRKLLCAILRKPRSETTKAEINTAVEIFDKYQAKQKAIAIIRQIQEELASKKSLPNIPEVKKVLIELSNRFLEPIHAVL